MPTSSPRHVYIHNTPVQVRNWQIGSDAITFRAMLRGERGADEILHLAEQKSVSIRWEDTPEYAGNIEIVQHSVTGDGPTAVHLLQLRIWPLPPAPEAKPSQPLSLEEHVAALRTEVASLRREVAALRGTAATGSRSPVPGGLTTLIEQEIDTSED